MRNLMRRKISTLVLVVALSLALMPLSLLMVSASPASSVVGTSTDPYAVFYPYQRKIFPAAGRFWAWYGEGPNFVYRSSTDGINWSDAISVGVVSQGGYNATTRFDGTFVHYVRFASFDLYYRRGTPNSDGSITWSAEEQTVYDGTSAGSDFYYEPNIAVDSGGYAWISAAYAYETEGVFVLKNASNDGTWNTDENFPYELKAGPYMSASIVPLTNSKVYAIYGKSKVKGYGKLWDGSSWGEEETTMSDPERIVGYSAVALGDDIHLVFLHDILETGIVYNKRTYGEGWGDEVTVQANQADIYMAPVLSLDTATNDLYCIWAGSPEANKIYYKRQVSGSWDANPTLWLDETSDTLYRNDALTCFYQTDDNKIGLLFTTKTSSPYNVKFALVSPVLPPNSPTLLLCEDLENPSQITDPTPEFSAIGTDNDGDSMNYYALQVDDDSGFGSPIWNKTKESILPFKNGIRCSDITYAGSSLTRGTTYNWRIKFWDNNGAEGAWSIEVATFTINQLPTTTNLKTEGEINPTRITTITPTFSWVYSDPDEDAQSHWQIWVGTTSEAYDMWNSGELSGVDNSDVYGGSALSGGETYYAQVRTKDDYEWSTWATGTFRINQLPTQTYSGQTFYDDLTPTLQWDFSDPDFDGQLGVKIQVDNDPSFDSLLWNHSDTTTTAQTKVYAGDALEKNVTYYARVQVRDGYEWSGTWSEDTFEILPISTLVVTEITVDSTPVDRKAHWAGDDDVIIYVTVKDNAGRDAIENVYFWIRDNNDAVVVDNVMHTRYENVGDNTKRFWYDYDPSDILLDDSLGEFDVKVQAVSATTENTKDYTELGFKLFTVDDHSITFTPVREIYAEGEIITFEPTVKSVATGLATDNAYLKLELISELGEILRTVAGYTDELGKLAAHTTLLEADIGFYDVRISTSKGAIDGQKLYEDVFSVVAEILVSVESITPADDSVSGLLRSRSIVPEDVIVKVFVYDTSGTELLSLTSGTIRVENMAPQLKEWEVPYDLTLAEGTYSYRVEAWTADLGTLYHVAFAEVKLSVAVSQQPVGDWVVFDTIEIKDGTFDVVIERESVVTNPTTVDKSNFYFREVVDAPTGSTVLVTVEGLPPTTLTVDQYGTIKRYFDVPASETIKVGMKVTIVSAVKVEYLGESEVVAAVPKTLKEYQYKVTNLTSTVLRGLELTFPVEGVVNAIDEEGRSLNFWESKSTIVEISELGSYEEITITLSSELAPSIDKVVDILIEWTIWGIPIMVFLLGGGIVLWVITKHRAGSLSQVTILMLPTILVVVGIWVGVL